MPRLTPRRRPSQPAPPAFRFLYPKVVPSNILLLQQLVCLLKAYMRLPWDAISATNDLHEIMSSALANLIRPLATKLELSTLPLHVHHILAAFLLYQGIFLLLSPALSHTIFFPATYKRLDRRGRVNWDVHVVSMVQSLVINSMAIYVIFWDEERHKASPTLSDPMANWRERLWGYSPQVGLVQSFASGYFLWDLAVSIEYFDVLGAGSLIHAVAALGITSMGYVSFGGWSSACRICSRCSAMLTMVQRPFGNYYGINYTLYELSTPFLNIHWFLDKLGKTGSRMQLYNGILLIATFFGCRLAWGSYQSWLIYSDLWEAWKARGSFAAAGCARFFRTTGLGSWMEVPLKCRVLPAWLGVSYALANTCLTLLNIFWFSKMVSAVRKRFAPPDLAAVKKQQ
jgi:hypothetical protein